MTNHPHDNLAAQWRRVGVLFNVSPSKHSPDLERLLLNTARACPDNPRLFTAGANWLRQWGALIARHRLKRLIVDELDPVHQPVLGFLVSSAIDLGAPSALQAVFESCQIAAPLRPLFDVFDRDDVTRRIAEQNASPLAKAWGLWAPPAEVKTDALRPLAWVVANNPIYRSRSQYRGDLRCSIIESLRYDTEAGHAESESQLARLCAASRPAIHEAVRQLEIEGRVRIASRASNERHRAITLAA